MHKKKLLIYMQSCFYISHIKLRLALFIGLNAYMYVSHEKKEWSNNFFKLFRKNCLPKDAETFIVSQKALFVVCQTIFFEDKILTKTFSPN